MCNNAHSSLHDVVSRAGQMLSIQIKVFNGKSGFAVTDLIAISSAHFMKAQRDSLSSLLLHIARWMARVGFVLPKTYAVSVLNCHASYLLRIILQVSRSYQCGNRKRCRDRPAGRSELEPLCHFPMMQSRWTRTMIPTCSEQRRQEPPLLQHHHHQAKPFKVGVGGL